METISITKEQGHILFSIGDKRALLDTGSPTSIATEAFGFLGEQHNLPRNLMGVAPQTMADVTGFPFDILIGCDILSHYTMRLRWTDGYLDIGEDIPDGNLCTPLQTLEGLPIFPLHLQGAQVKGILDTGAHLSYIDPERVAGRSRSGRREDFHPCVGRFFADTYSMPTALDHSPVNIEYGIMPDGLAALLGIVLQLAGASAVVGTQLLEYFDCTISWPQKTISWTRVA